MLTKAFENLRFRVFMLAICAVWLCAAVAIATSLLSVPAYASAGCNAGGEGATSCSAGENGCSVTCTSGYYACCNGAGSQSSCTCTKGIPPS